MSRVDTDAGCPRPGPTAARGRYQPAHPSPWQPQPHSWTLARKGAGSRKPFAQRLLGAPCGAPPSAPRTLLAPSSAASLRPHGGGAEPSSAPHLGGGARGMGLLGPAPRPRPGPGPTSRPRASLGLNRRSRGHPSTPPAGSRIPHYAADPNPCSRDSPATLEELSSGLAALLQVTRCAPGGRQAIPQLQLSPAQARLNPGPPLLRAQEERPVQLPSVPARGEGGGSGLQRCDPCFSDSGPSHLGGKKRPLPPLPSLSAATLTAALRPRIPGIALRGRLAGPEKRAEHAHARAGAGRHRGRTLEGRGLRARVPAGRARGDGSQDYAEMGVGAAARGGASPASASGLREHKASWVWALDGRPWRWVLICVPSTVHNRPEGRGEETGTPPIFRTRFLEPARKSWDSMWGPDL